MHRTPTAGDNVVDSRDIIERLRDLQSLRDDLEREAKDTKERIHQLQFGDGEVLLALCESEATELEALTDKETDIWTTESGDTLAYSIDYGEEEESEFQALKALDDEGDGATCDWRHGGTLILDSYFETYAQELAEDTWAISRDAQWPLSYIDWEAAADALKNDYNQIDWDGNTYWIRA